MNEYKDESYYMKLQREESVEQFDEVRREQEEYREDLMEMHFAPSEPW